MGGLFFWILVCVYLGWYEARDLRKKICDLQARVSDLQDDLRTNERNLREYLYGG